MNAWFFKGTSTWFGRKNLPQRREPMNRLFRQATLLAIGASLFVAARQADADFYPGNDRASLAAEAAWARVPDAIQGSNIYIVPGTSNWRYVESDFGAYLALAHSPLGNFMIDPPHNGFATFSDPDIRRFVENAGPGFGGQCLSFVSLLLLRSGCTGWNQDQFLRTYDQLDDAANRALLGIHDSNWGDILFRSKPVRDRHTAVILLKDDDGVWVGDSNFIGGAGTQKIGIHHMRWKESDGYRVADLPTLLRVLGSRH
jgi:hypothetical protein